MPKKWDVAGNWQIFEQAALRCAADQIDVLVTPECWLDGYVAAEKDWTVERFAEVAQTVGDSVYIDRVRQLAIDLNTNVVFGFTEKGEDKFFNCALVVDRKGEIVGRYNKTHLQAHDKRFVPGDGLPVFELDFGTVGIVICADRRWPETIRSLRLQGAELLLMPSYDMWHIENEWWMRTRSYENGLFLCFAHPNVAFITDPQGELIAKLQSNQPGLLVHDVDLDRVDIHHIADRRPEIYGAITEPNPVPALRKHKD